MREPKPGPPEGYTSVELHAPTAAKVKAGGGLGEWRKPIHGTAVAVAPDGRTVLAHVRTLGTQLPLKMRRYSLRVTGVTFDRLVPLLGRNTKSDIAPYDTMAAARKAGTALIKQLVEAAT